MRESVSAVPLQRNSLSTPRCDPQNSRDFSELYMRFCAHLPGRLSPSGLARMAVRRHARREGSSPRARRGPPMGRGRSVRLTSVSWHAFWDRPNGVVGMRVRLPGDDQIVEATFCEV
jgi:hypothetical protein